MHLLWKHLQPLHSAAEGACLAPCRGSLPLLIFLLCHWLLPPSRMLNAVFRAVAIFAKHFLTRSCSVTSFEVALSPRKLAQLSFYLCLCVRANYSRSCVCLRMRKERHVENADETLRNNIKDGDTWNKCSGKSVDWIQPAEDSSFKISWLIQV